MCYSMAMAKVQKKTTHKKTVQFEPERVLFMVAIVAVLTLVFVGALATL